MKQDVREMRGVVGTAANDVVPVRVTDVWSYAFLTYESFKGVPLKPDECRSLARDLYRVARRIEARAAIAKATGND